MREHLTGDDLFAQVILVRDTDRRTIVLLEGDSDCRALDPHVDDDATQTMPGYSKRTVEDAIGLVDANRVERVLAVMDRDWVGVLDPANPSGNVVYTDDYDLDATIMFASDVLDRVIVNLCELDRVRKHEKDRGTLARDIVVALSYPVGLARFVSARDSLDARLRDFPVHTVVDAKDSVVDIDKMCVIASARSADCQAAPKAFAAAVRDADDGTHTRRFFCSGHDLSAVIAHLVRTVWGGGAHSSDTVERICRAAMSCADLASTRLYEAVSKWAEDSGTRVWNCA